MTSDRRARVRAILRAHWCRMRDRDAARIRAAALTHGLLRFPASWDSGTVWSQCPVPDQYDWSGLERPSRQTLLTAVRQTVIHKG